MITKNYLSTIMVADQYSRTAYISDRYFLSSFIFLWYLEKAMRRVIEVLYNQKPISTFIQYCWTELPELQLYSTPP